MLAGVRSAGGSLALRFQPALPCSFNRPPFVMRRFVRPILIVCLALLVPIIPFLGFGPWLEDLVAAWLDPPPPSGVLAALVVGLLASDILLPIPSSVVSTAAGAQLGIVVAVAASWIGMTAGAAWASRWPGALAVRWPRVLLRWTT